MDFVFWVSSSVCICRDGDSIVPSVLCAVVLSSCVICTLCGSDPDVSVIVGSRVLGVRFALPFVIKFPYHHVVVAFR